MNKRATILPESSLYVHITKKQSFKKIELRCDLHEMHHPHVRYRVARWLTGRASIPGQVAAV